MSEWGEPRRFHESELPSEVRTVLESAALDDPSAERVAGVEARIGAILGWAAGGGSSSSPDGSGSPGHGGAGPTGSASATGASIAAGKALVGAAVLAGAIGVTAWLVDRPSEPAEQAPSAESTSVPPPRMAEPVPPRPRRATAPPRAPSEEATEPAPTARRIRRSEPRPPPAVEPPAESAPPHPTISALAQELRLVDAARGALDATPSRALELAEDHRAQFPQGTLAPERELIAVEALVALGRTTDAQARATALERDFPASPAAHRARALITSPPPAQ